MSRSWRIQSRTCVDQAALIPDFPDLQHDFRDNFLKKVIFGTSKNEIICHGIPSPKDVLREGDIINVDVTTYYKKFHGDILYTNRTFLVGKVTPEIQKLVDITYQRMMAEIATVRPGSHLGDIGAAIEKIAHDHVRIYVRSGHGAVNAQHANVWQAG